MKIEFDVPNFERELEISIVIRKDGEVVCKATPPAPDEQKKVTEANTTKTVKRSAGNLMDTNF